MLRPTLSRLRCPACASTLALAVSRGDEFEVTAGSLTCAAPACGLIFPIVAGVAVLVEDVRGYFLDHVKGITRLVPDQDIPGEFLDEFFEARDEIEAEHIEEDLEAERVVALYLMNHYLDAEAAGLGTKAPLISALVREYWDHGPLTRIEAWLRGQDEAVVELGCGVGGLARRLKGRSYLGIDGSFASIALGRHLALGVPYAGKIRVPGDLLDGPVSREVAIPLPERAPDGSVDLVVGDLVQVPLARGEFGVAIALNAIDMLEEPASLPRLQHELLRAGGTAIQSCPYIWHEAIARELREKLPAGIRDSASAVEWLYGEAGLRIEEKVDGVPWLFFKHYRQLEVYSVHLFRARKS